MDDDTGFDLQRCHTNVQKEVARLAEAYTMVCKERDELKVALNALQQQSRLDSGDTSFAAYTSGESEVQLFRLYFTDNVMAMISDLFNIMDTTKKGYISKQDLDMDHLQGVELWQQILHIFDIDGDGTISATEFLNGFAQSARTCVFVAPLEEVTFGSFLYQLQVKIDNFGACEITKMYEMVKDSVKDKATMSIDQATQVTHRSNQVYTSFISQPVVAEMETIFNALRDTSHNNTCITVQSFAKAGAKLGKWGDLVKYFDSDNSGTIEGAEFIHGFRKWIRDTPFKVPQGSRTIEDLLKSMTTRANEL